MSLTKVSYSMINGAAANVLDYGADSTGVASASAALQSAIDSFGGNTGVVYFPNGSYKLTVNVTLPSNITLLSYGAIIVCNGFGFVVGASKSNIVIDGLRFNQAYTTGYPNTIATPSTCTQVTIQNCLFYGGGFYVLSLGGRSLRVLNNRFTGTPGAAHVATAAGYDVLISGNQFYDIGLSYVVILRNGIGINVSNNKTRQVSTFKFNFSRFICRRNRRNSLSDCCSTYRAREDTFTGSSRLGAGSASETYFCA